MAIAKRIERGQLLVLKTITRSPIILKELLTIGEDLRNGTRSIKEIVQFDDEELTEEKIENKTKKTLKVLDNIAKLYNECLREAAKLERMTKSKKRPYLRAKYHVSRLRIEMSQLARSIEFHLFEKKRLIDKIRQHGRAAAVPRARSRKARAPRRRLQGRQRRRSAQGTAHAPHRAARNRSIERDRPDRSEADASGDSSGRS